MTDWYRTYVVYVAPAIQIAVLTVVIYWLLLSVERISAGVKLRGLAVLLIALVLGALAARLLQLHAIDWLLQHAVSFAVLLLAIIFQPEVRRLFTRVGGLLATHNFEEHGRIREHLVNAIDYMSTHRIGALIVIERSARLDDYVAASPLDAQVTSKLLVALFWKDSPLHDGALIIRSGRVAAAGVILPLTENYQYKDLAGTRHRAGIGISEETDALALLVSEETGIISVADRSKLTRNLTREDLEILLGRVFGHVTEVSA